MQTGKYNTLKVARRVDFGVYLSDEKGAEVLLPARYVPEDTNIGDELRVFVYNDSEDRPVATTETPYAQVGDFAFLQVTDVNKVGAFLDWGIPQKHLLVPFSEQKIKMRPGCIYPVYVYLDHESGRVVATAKIHKYLGNVPPEYTPGQKVKALVYQHSELGYKAVVDNMFDGLFYENELTRPLEVEEAVKAYVKFVRPDGKIDLSLPGAALDRTQILADKIMSRLELNGGSIPLGDASSPEEIRRSFDCSKKDFKRALSYLYKRRRITLQPCCINSQAPDA